MFESFFSFLFSFFRGVETPVVVVPEEPTVVVEEVQETQTPTIRGEDSPLSMLSFYNQEFVGTDFTVGNLLQDWGTHKSYYATFMSNGLKISGTWHVPSGDGPFPLLILNHGYFPPSEYTNGYGFGREQKYFARNGYAVFHNDYRGYAYSDSDPQAYSGRRFGDTGYATDAINAILAIQEAGFENIDTTRVGMFGHSLGGGVTLNAALAKPELIDAAILWGPVSSDYYDNFEKWTKDRLTNEGRAIFEEDFGPTTDPASFKAVSARTYLDRLEIPLYIQHGTEDESCPVEWARATKQELERLSKNFEYTEYEGYPHVFWNENWDNAAADALGFFEEHLKGE